MRAEKPLHGWLDQGARDPLEGKALAQKLLAEMLGLSGLREVPAKPFAPETVGPPAG